MFRVVCLLLILAAPAQAECFAAYKAKRAENAQLELHYGIVAIGNNCGDAEGARQEVARRIAADGWQLLSLEDILTREQAEARKRSAGQYYLRY